MPLLRFRPYGYEPCVQAADSTRLRGEREDLQAELASADANLAAADARANGADAELEDAQVLLRS